MHSLPQQVVSSVYKVTQADSASLQCCDVVGEDHTTISPTEQRGHLRLSDRVGPTGHPSTLSIKLVSALTRYEVEGSTHREQEYIDRLRWVQLFGVILQIFSGSVPLHVWHVGDQGRVEFRLRKPESAA
jgi:hypothetical protein